MITSLNRLFKKKIVFKNGTVKNRKMLKSISFDETRKSEKDADRILIDCDIANVFITTSKEKFITARLFGSCLTDFSTPTFSLCQDKKLTSIEFQNSGKVFSGELFLNITIPDIIHDIININTTSGKVIINNSVQTRQLLINTISGKATILTRCSNSIVKTVSGDVDFQLHANNNGSCRIETVSGQVKLAIAGIEEVNLSLDSKSEKIEKTFDLVELGYYAKIVIKTINGNISIENCKSSLDEEKTHYMYEET